MREVEQSLGPGCEEVWGGRRSFGDVGAGILQCQGFKLNGGEEERPSPPPAASSPGIISVRGPS